MNRTFNAIDVETANADRASICQIGIVKVENGEIKDQWQTLVNPECWFDPLNVSIHGIKEKYVKESPTMPELRGELRKRLRGSVLVSHTSFDRVAFERCMSRYNLEQLQVKWLDSAKIARRAWPEDYGHSGYGLKNIAYDLGIQFKHHDALEDARAAAEVVLQACDSSRMDIDDWLIRVEQPIFPSKHKRTKPIKHTKHCIKREGNIEGDLYGEIMVFTGVLTIPRYKAADIADKAGCKVVESVTRKTTILVAGIQNKAFLKEGYDKSSKHRKAEELIGNGLDIRIISETDFFELMNATNARTPVPQSVAK